MSTLPAEMINQICWNLCPTEDDADSWAWKRGTMFNLMCAGKILYHAVRPVLYHTLDGKCPLQDFVLLCIRKPETAKFVKVIRFGFLQPTDGSAGFKSSDVTTMIDATKSLPISVQLRDAIQADLRASDPSDAQAAMLLSLCTNLEVLQAYICPLGEREFRDTLLRSVPIDAVVHRPPHVTPVKYPSTDWRTGSSPLQNLRVFHAAGTDDVSVDRDGRKIPMSETFPFMYLPNLEVFTGSNMAMVSNWAFRKERNSFSVTPPLPNMRKIAISGESCIDAHCVESLLFIYRGLRELDVDADGHLFNDHNRRGGSGLGDALRSHGLKLEKLSIRFYELSFDSTRFRAAPVGNLKQLNRLREVNAYWRVVFGGDEHRSHVIRADYLTQTLPESLETFEITKARDLERDRAKVFDAQLLELMEDGKFDKLRTIKAERFRPFALDLPPGWENCTTARSKAKRPRSCGYSDPAFRGQCMILRKQEHDL